ncbi:MAG: DUF4097 family beta strand repeat protein [Clostridia bacterium]|nr:DUF4097 family beta strand repeat protein [Clostridia bacterium]
MTDNQKFIKYLAIGLAIFLIILIVVGVIGAFTTLGVLFGGVKNEPQKNGDMYVYSDFQNTVNLDADIGVSYFKIDTGDKLSVETNSDKIKVYQKGNTLVIEETSKWNLISKDKFEITLFVPADFSFSDVEISTGAGKFDAARLSAQEIDLELGAGDVEIGTLEALRDIDISGGAGRIRINDGSLYNLDLEMGVGKLEITSTMLGENKIECGIGDADINLTDTLSAYRISVDKGIGNAKLNGNTVADGTNYGEGTNRIKIDCGIGDLNITTK